MLSPYTARKSLTTWHLQILATKDKDEAAESFKDDLTLTVREVPLILTPAQVKNMTLEDMVSIWKVSYQLYITLLNCLMLVVSNTFCYTFACWHLHKCQLAYDMPPGWQSDMRGGLQEYVNELASALVETDKNPHDAVAAEKIKRLVNEAVRTAHTPVELHNVRLTSS